MLEESDVTEMTGAEVLHAIKLKLTSMVGEKVHITANHGRRKRSSLNGILEGTYKSLFTVLIPASETAPAARMSFTYCDVLTRAVIVQPIQQYEKELAADIVIA